MDAGRRARLDARFPATGRGGPGDPPELDHQDDEDERDDRDRQQRDERAPVRDDELGRELEDAVQRSSSIGTAVSRGVVA